MRFVELRGPGSLKVAAALRNAGPVLKRMGTWLVSRAQRSFRDQGYGTKKWAPHWAPNVPAILADLEAGRTPAARHLARSGRPAGVNTGALRASVTFRVVGHLVEWGSRLSYARRFHAGGPSTLAVTDKVRAGLRDLLRKRKDLRDLGWLFARRYRRFTIRVRPRPFVGWDQKDRQTCADILRQWLRGA